MKYAKSKQAGFTLIELVIVIVILGILAATAAPKFINIQSEAHIGTLNAIKASMESATAIVHSKSLIAGNNQALNATVSVDSGSGTLNINYGYPRGEQTDWTTHLLDIDTADFATADASGNSIFYVYPQGYASPTAGTPGTCFVRYTETTDAAVKPVIDLVTTGC